MLFAEADAVSPFTIIGFVVAQVVAYFVAKRIAGGAAVDLKAVAEVAAKKLTEVADGKMLDLKAVAEVAAKKLTEVADGKLTEVKQTAEVAAMIQTNTTKLGELQQQIAGLTKAMETSRPGKSK